MSARRLRRFRQRRRLARGIYRFNPGSRRLVGIRHGRVRFVAVASRRATSSRRALRAYLRLAGLR